MAPVSPGRAQSLIGRGQQRPAASPPEQQAAKEAQQRSRFLYASESGNGNASIDSQPFDDSLFDFDIDWYAEQELYTEEASQASATEASLDDRASVRYPLWLDPAAEDVTRPQSDPELIPVLAAAQMEGSAEAAGTACAAQNTKSVRTQLASPPIPLPVKAPRVSRSRGVSESVASVLYGPRVVVLLGLALTCEILVAGLIMKAGYTISIL